MVLILGAHLAKDKTFLNTAEKIIDLNSNIVSIFISSPHAGKVSKISLSDISETNEWLCSNNIELVIHGKYIINFANPKAFNYHIPSEEMKEGMKFNCLGVVYHIGKAGKLSIPEAEDNMRTNVMKAIDKTFTKKSKFKMIIETSAGEGTAILTTIGDLARWYDTLPEKYRKHIKFCIDTCHIFSAGYDIRTKKGMKEYLSLWNKLISRKLISCIHLNDSAVPLDSRKDRHESFTKGYITNPTLGGSKTGITYLLEYSKRYSIPLILERNSKAKLKLEEEIGILKSWI
jgi:deoxyribonuclease-4